MPINRKWIERTARHIAEMAVIHARVSVNSTPGVSPRMSTAMHTALTETEEGVWITALTTEIETWLGGVVVPTARKKAALALRREQRARAREEQ